MSCRDFAATDWRALVAERDETGEDPAGWDASMAHVDACDDCRRVALMADPSLVFRRLPRVETDAADVESMRQAVASLRRASRVTAVESDVDAGAGPADRRFRPGSSLRRVAAGLLLAAAGLGAWLVGPTLLDHAGVAGTAEAVTAAGSEVQVPSSAAGLAGDPRIDPFATASRLSAEELAARPVFEELSQPRAADVYQVGEEDLLVVMVVDETLDI